MRIYVETPESAFEADTIDHDPDLDGTFEALDEYGDRLRINGWCCHIEVLDADAVAA